MAELMRNQHEILKKALQNAVTQTTITVDEQVEPEELRAIRMSTSPTNVLTTEQCRTLLQHLGELLESVQGLNMAYRLNTEAAQLGSVDILNLIRHSGESRNP